MGIPRSPAVRRPTRKAEREPSPAEIWAREEAAARRGALEDLLAQHIRAWGLPTPEREHRFDPVRLWRFDFAFVQFHLAVEVEGGTWAQGRHTRGRGFEVDAEKHAEAVRQGWTVLRFTAGQIRTGYAIRVIEDVLSKRPPG